MKTSPRRSFLLIAQLCVLALAATLPATAHARAAPDIASQLDALVSASFDARHAGAVVLVKRGDRVLLRKAYGMADLELGVPMRPELIFKLGSLTKQLTAAAIMILVDRGRLSLQDDVHKLIPELPRKLPVITIEQLLTHTSGIPSYTEQPAFARRSREALTHEELVATFKDLPLDFSPGEKWRYSNSGYYLLGMVIEKISGMSYAKFLDANIFAPLAMTHSRYDDGKQLVVGRVSGYDRAGDQLTHAEPISMTAPFAAGGLISNVDDLARWDRAISDGKLLAPRSWERVFTAAKLEDGSSTHYGFGWTIGQWQGHRMLSHGGAIPGFSAAIVRLPEDRALAVVLCNSLPAATNPMDLAVKLAAAAIGEPMADPKAVAIEPTTLERYAGVYRVDDKLRVFVRRDGDHLTLQRSGGPRLRLAAASIGAFFVKDTSLRVAFLDDEAGHVTALEASQADGMTMRHPRTDEALPAERTEVTLDPKILDRYVGAFELAPGFVIVVTRVGSRLFAQATGQPRFELFATAADELFLKEVDAQLSFRVASDGRADTLVLHQGGRDLVGKRCDGK